jgi:REP element-mobilizing transposase RayT
MDLKPIKIEDCSQFFTATILNWNKLLTPESYKLIIVESLQYLVNAERVVVYGYVIMDNHIHIIWKPTLLYSLKHTQLSFMKFTAQRIKIDLVSHHRDILKQFLVASKDRVYQFWQRNALCVDLYSNTIIEQKLKYIHQNPVRARMCANTVDYKFSSARFYEGLGDEFELLTDFR